MFTVLLDSPATPVKRLQIAKLGDYSDPARYGDFSITTQNVENWQKHLQALPGGEALIDFEHRSERAPRDSKAAGWITGISLDGDAVMADVNWTPGGEQAIRDREYRFVSPVYGPLATDKGDVFEDALSSVALTNKPFLGSMPAVSLASQERVSAAIDEDPAARFYTRALDGELGEATRALVLLDVDADERKQALKEGNSLPDGSYPIRNTAQLEAAAILAASGHGDVVAARKLITRRAKELGVPLTSLRGFASKTPAKSLDSRRPMHPDLLKALGLDGDEDLVKALEAGELSDEQNTKLLDAATALKAKADKPAPKPAPETKTLEQQAADEGKRIMDAGALTTLEQQAASSVVLLEKVTALETERKQERFDARFKELETSGHLLPADRDDELLFYGSDPDRWVERTKRLEAAPPKVNVRPNGKPAIDFSADDVATEDLLAAGVHPDSHMLDQEIRKHIVEKGLPDSAYPKLLETYQKNGRLPA